MRGVICVLVLFSCHVLQASAQTKKPDKVIPDINTQICILPVESIPHFPGGHQKLQKFLAKNLKYPDSEVQGRVILMFIVEKDGRITHVKVIKSVAPEIDAEAVRVIKLSPKWIPKKENGKPVRCRMMLPINFSL